jgi:two-component system, NtrC family, sensor kinase
VALARQTATSEILRVISGSPTDVQPVFDSIVLTAARLFRRDLAFILACDATTYWPAATAGPEGLRTPPDRAPVAIDTGANFPSRAIVTRKNLHLPDWSAVELPEYERMVHETLGINSALYLPLLREGECIGVLGIAGKRAGIFGASEIALAESFRDQALIAIENTRLFNEVRARTDDVRESLTYQTAISNVLNVISRSPSDIQPVLDTIAETAQHLCQSEHAYIFRLDGEKYHLAAARDVRPERIEFLKDNPIAPNRGSTVGRVALERRPIHVMDALADSEYKLSMVGHGGRTILGVPLLHDGVAIGVIVLTRGVVRPFVERQIELVSTFADQAVIAIENVRLFDEVQARTRDLTEALTYQTGSGNILKVIASSPTDVGPVLKAIVENACELCEADDAVVNLRDGDDLLYGAQHGTIPIGFEKRPINRNWVTGRSVVDKAPVHLHDVLSAEGAEFPEAQEMSRRSGMRTILSVPLLRTNEGIGAIILRRTEVNPFNEKQIALLQTFADQAVIAIGNVRLFEEVQAKTRDLSEALQQQTATADVLKVISRSAFDLDIVMNTLANSAAELCNASLSGLYLREGDVLALRGHSEVDEDLARSLRQTPVQIDNESHMGRAILNGAIANIGDFENDQNTRLRTFQKVLGFKAILFVPLMREGRGVGVFSLARNYLGEFSQRQIELVQTFADQAVIAIENVRLFDEVQARTKELATSLDELRTAQDRLVQTEKLASLGQLTAGIAHEIKNPLNFVNNFSSLSAELTDELNDVLKQATLSEKIRQEVDELTQLLKDNLKKVVQHGKRADSIVKNMLLHSREGSGDHRPADINALLDESLNLAYHGARAEKPQFNVTLQRSFDETAGEIEVFPQEITRVFLNLISNGFYAVTKRKAENGNPDFEPAVMAATRNLGGSVEIRIRDNGTGIPAEVREKMFNPFFTTKPAGEGTGLGLSMSHDIIVKQHGGTIDVETKPGEFTEFRIVLPRTSNVEEKSQEKFQEKPQEKKRGPT